MTTEEKSSDRIGNLLNHFKRLDGRLASSCDLISVCGGLLIASKNASQAMCSSELDCSELDVAIRKSEKALGEWIKESRSK